MLEYGVDERRYGAALYKYDEYTQEQQDGNDGQQPEFFRAFIKDHNSRRNSIRIDP